MTTTIDRVNQILANNRTKKVISAQQKATREILCLDVARRDTQELFSILQGCSIVEYNRNGEKAFRLNPYKVYKALYQERYKGLIRNDSERLPEQQFTTAVIAAVKFCIGTVFRLPTPELKAAWLAVIGEDSEFGTKQVTLQRAVLPQDFAMKSFLLSRYGTAETEETEETAE